MVESPEPWMLDFFSMIEVQMDFGCHKYLCLSISFVSSSRLEVFSENIQLARSKCLPLWVEIAATMFALGFGFSSEPVCFEYLLPLDYQQTDYLVQPVLVPAHFSSSRIATHSYFAIHLRV